MSAMDRVRSWFTSLKFATAGTIFLCVVIWIFGWPSIERGCMSAVAVAHGDVSRIFLSPLIHSRFPLHLLFNMLVLGPLGSSLEAQYGSFTFAGILAVAAVGSSIVSLILQGTWLLLTGSSSVAYSCHVGFSGAIFALLVLDVHSASSSGRPRSLFGLVSVPAAVYPLLLLLVLQLLIPSASFVGHLSGIAVGYAILLSQHIILLSPIVAARLTTLLPMSVQSSPYFASPPTMLPPTTGIAAPYVAMRTYVSSLIPRQHGAPAGAGGQSQSSGYSTAGGSGGSSAHNEVEMRPFPQFPGEGNRLGDSNV